MNGPLAMYTSNVIYETVPITATVLYDKACSPTVGTDRDIFWAIADSDAFRVDPASLL